MERQDSSGPFYRCENWGREKHLALSQTARQWFFGLQTPSLSFLRVWADPRNGEAEWAWVAMVMIFPHQHSDGTWIWMERDHLRSISAAPPRRWSFAIPQRKAAAFPLVAYEATEPLDSKVLGHWGLWSGTRMGSRCFWNPNEQPHTCLPKVSDLPMCLRTRALIQLVLQLRASGRRQPSDDGNLFLSHKA